jgi:hypothetical protein
MAYLIIELNFPDLQIEDLNSKYGPNSGDKQDTLSQAIDACASIACGAKSGSVQSTTRSSTAGVTPSGAGSKQVSYS